MIPPKLLIVEDELLVAMNIRRRLEAAGYTVCGIAMSSDEALARTRELKPHLVLMDIQLRGEMDGIEAADIIRTELDVPVIFVTANADASTLARAQATAPFNFLVKPIKERELTSSIETSIHHHSAQKQLREMRDELESRVELRTAAYRRINLELKNEIVRHRETVKALELARDAALSASRAKSQFLACMSHELRTPMNSILSLTEVMLDDVRSETDRDCLSVIHDSAESLLGLINNLLDYSRAQSGKIELTPCSFDLRNQFNSLFITLEQHAREKKLQLTSEISPDVPALVIGDPLRLAQILINLVGNAIKFTDEGEIDVQVGIRVRDTRRVCLEVSVRDTGPGIPVEKQRCIFEPFTQADNSDTRRHEGAGLGLSICEQLVALMGGRIWLHSQPGHGSTFHFLAWMETPAAETQAIVPFPSTGQKTSSISA